MVLARSTSRTIGDLAAGRAAADRHLPPKISVSRQKRNSTWSMDEFHVESRLLNSTWSIDVEQEFGRETVCICMHAHSVLHR